MGGVPVLLMVTLFGTLSVQPHPGVCLSRTADVRSFSESSFSDSGYLAHRPRSESALADQVQEFDRVVHLVSDNSADRSSTYSSSANTRDVQQTNDLSPIAIPVLRSVASERILNAASNSRVITVRKPDNTGTTGSGFSFPSVPPSLAESGQTLAQNVDRAGRPIAPSASSQGVTNGTTLPSTTATNPPSFSVPPFTSSAEANPVASALGASTLGTPPVSQRDPTTRATNWGQFPLPTTAAPVTAAPVTAANPTGFGVNPVPATNAAASGIRSAGVSPLLPTDTFGRTPSGLAPATTGRSVQPSFGTRPQSTGNTGTPNFVHVPTTDSIFNRSHTVANTSANNFSVGSNASRPGIVPATTNTLNSNRSNATGQSFGGVPVGQPPIGRFGANPSATNYPISSTNAPSSDTGFSTSRPDARLSAAQVAAGAWSVDAFGQPVDRTGQRIASVPTTTGSQQIDQHARANGATGFGGSYTNQTATPMPGVRPHAVEGNSATYGNAAMHGGGVPKQATLPVSGKSSQATRSTLASDNSNFTTVAETQVIETQLVTTQPLFNGLLLISIVANIYLIFWLKNLRLQYHEMVAAKRMASSNATSN